MKYKYLNKYNYKIKNLQEINKLVGNFKSRKKKISMCHGVFDIVHPGHVRHLFYAKSKADILIVALGKPEFITADMIKDDVCIVDVGITRIQSQETKSGWKLKGDVAFKECQHKSSFITPVPGGVGPMTIAMLLRNTLKSATKQVY